MHISSNPFICAQSQNGNEAHFKNLKYHMIVRINIIGPLKKWHNGNMYINRIQMVLCFLSFVDYVAPIAVEETGGG